MKEPQDLEPGDDAFVYAGSHYGEIHVSGVRCAVTEDHQHAS